MWDLHVAVRSGLPCVPWIVHDVRQPNVVVMVVVVFTASSVLEVELERDVVVSVVPIVVVVLAAVLVVTMVVVAVVELVAFVVVVAIVVLLNTVVAFVDAKEVVATAASCEVDGIRDVVVHPRFS